MQDGTNALQGILPFLVPYLIRKRLQSVDSIPNLRFVLPNRNNDWVCIEPGWNAIAS